MEWFWSSFSWNCVAHQLDAKHLHCSRHRAKGNKNRIWPLFHSFYCAGSVSPADEHLSVSYQQLRVWNRAQIRSTNEGRRWPVDNLLYTISRLLASITRNRCSSTGAAELFTSTFVMSNWDAFCELLGNTYWQPFWAWKSRFPHSKSIPTSQQMIWCRWRRLS